MTVFFYLYSFILYMDFFPRKEQVCTHLFSFSSLRVVFHLTLFDPPLWPLTSWQKAELSLNSTSHHSPPLPPNLWIPITFPAVTKRGPLLYRSLFLSKNLNAGPIVLHETGHVYWAEPGSRSHNPPSISFGHILCVQMSLWTKRGSSLWMYCYCFHSMGGVGVEGGRGKVVY